VRDLLHWFPNSSTRRQTAIRLLVVAASLLLARFAQGRFDRNVVDHLAFALYGVAGLLFVWACGSVTLEREWQPAAENSDTRPPLARSARLVSVLLTVAIVGCLDFGGNRWRPVGLLLWGGGLLSCLFYLYATASPKALGDRLAELCSSRPLAVARIWLLVGAAVLIGAFLRLHQLDVIPADIGWDLPYNYTDVLSIQRGEYRIFFPANQGREGLFFYLIALVTRFAELSHFSIKLTSALVGTLTIVAMYLLGRELFDSALGIVAAFLLAINRWHIILSRSGFRVILLPLFTILLLHMVVRALRKGRPFDFALAGLVMGLGMHSYTSIAFAVVAVVVALALRSFSAQRPNWRALLPLLALMFAVAAVAYAPLLRYALEYPQEYLFRVALQVRLLTADPGRPSMTWPLLLENVRTSLLMYNVYGDSNVRFNVAFFRHFGLVSGILLVLGLFYSVWRWRRGNNGMVLVMFFLLIVPMTLAMFPHEMPNVFRAAGTIGPALLLASMPLLAVYRRIQEMARTYMPYDMLSRLRVSAAGDSYEFRWQLGRRGFLILASVVAIALPLIAEANETRDFYFRRFADVLPDRQNVSIAQEMARQMEAYGDLDLCYIKVWPHWFDGRALQTYLRRPYGAWNPEFSELSADRAPLSTISERGMIIVHPQDTVGLEALREAFPRHATVTHYLPDGSPGFVVIYVERT
jgi:4-amino-4-deoxy-L-arabinose transferase-like glycosyltransferase